MVDDQTPPKFDPWNEYDGMVQDLLDALSRAGEGFRVDLPLTETFGAAWDIRIEVAFLPAPQRSAVAVERFYLVGLTRSGEPHFFKRSDTPADVVMVFDALNYGILGEVPHPLEALLDHHEDHPVRHWVKADALKGLVMPSFKEAFEAHRWMEH